MPAFSNCYIIAPDRKTDGDGAPSSGDLIIIDPGVMEEPMLNFIEKDHYTLRAVFLTHDHESHSNGLRAIKRIYGGVDVYAAAPHVKEIKTNMVRDGDTVKIGEFTVKVISTPGHSADSVVFFIDHCLFSGDALVAGSLGSTASAYGAMRQISTIQNKIFSLPGNYIVFPGHGPPSSLEAERTFNEGIHFYAETRRRAERMNFQADLT
jgi:glyoxylase-like metal-dependent hydrolase (beta-lactamase superfamily II)